MSLEMRSLLAMAENGIPSVMPLRILHDFLLLTPNEASLDFQPSKMVFHVFIL
jgi:hypothetical protein